MSEAKEMLTTDEAAQRLGVSRGRIWQFICEGRLPAVKRGRDRFIDPHDLARLERRPTGRPRKTGRR